MFRHRLFQECCLFFLPIVTRMITHVLFFDDFFLNLFIAFVFTRILLIVVTVFLSYFLSHHLLIHHHYWHWFYIIAAFYDLLGFLQVNNWLLLLGECIDER